MWYRLTQLSPCPKGSKWAKVKKHLVQAGREQGLDRYTLNSKPSNLGNAFATVPREIMRLSVLIVGGKSGF